MQLSFLLFGLGFILLVIGAESLVRGASAMARAAGIKPLVIGLTVVAFGTSAPELVVTLQAVAKGSGGLAVGNIVGSNLFNVTVILGLSAMVQSLSVQTQVVRFEMPLMLVASAAFMAFSLSGEKISRWEGGLLLAALVAYLAWQLRTANRESLPAPATGERAAKADAPTQPGPSYRAAILLVLAGLGGLLLGANLLVDSAVLIARALEVPEAVIGLTIVAAGTSLPELATSMVAAFRRETDMAVGNIVGSNLFNVLCIGGAAGLAGPVVLEGIAWTDLAMMLGVSLLVLPLMRTGFRIVFWEGAALLVVYAVYLALRWP
jgi:cation:H+ antiporter